MRQLLILALTLIVGGCGFERGSPFAGTRVPDVGPWQDLGPLTVCGAVGGPRAVAPSLGVAGLCGERSTTACTVDADCASRERCLCGRCSVAVCDSADECSGGFVCTFGDRRCDHACDADADCARGERCVPGRHVCRGSCATSADCQHGESCQSSTGLCISTACDENGPCASCAIQRFGALLSDPSPLVTSDGVDLWLTHVDPGGNAHLERAHGDGLSFIFDHSVVAPDGRAPSVARLSDGSYALVYENGASLYVTRSINGVDWMTPTLALPNARQPSLAIAPDGTPLLWGVDGDGNIIRVSGTPDLVFSTPVVTLTPTSARTPLWPDVDALASPFIDPYVDADGSPRWRLWFAAHGTESGPSSQFGSPVPTPPDWSIGLAVSSDGVTFTPDPYDPVFDRTTDFINHPSELDPAVVRLADHWLLYYRRAKADGSAGETLAVARSPAVPR